MSPISYLGMTHGRRHVFFLYLGCLEHSPLVPLPFKLDMGHSTWVQVYNFQNFLVKFVCMVEGEQTPNRPLQILDWLFFSLFVVSCGFLLVRGGYVRIINPPLSIYILIDNISSLRSHLLEFGATSAIGATGATGSNH